MSRSKQRDSSALVYGGVPRAQLMPPEVGLRKKERSRRRALVSLTLLVLLVVVAGVVGAYWLAAQAEQRLAEERAITQQLLDEQLQYSDVLGIQARLDAVDAQRSILTDAEVYWQEELLPYLAVLAEEEIIEGLTVSGNAPFESPLVLTGPLRSPRSATMLLTIRTPALPDIPRWMAAWERLGTFADASVDSVVADAETAYVTIVTINLNASVLSERAAAGEDE